jgi:hypothetical protein
VRVNALTVRFDHAEELTQAGRATEGEQIIGAQERAELLAGNEALRAHPLYGSETAGAVLGCPERDGLF